MSQDNRQTTPKPFDFVPLPSEAKRRRTKGHNLYHLKNFSGRLDYHLIALTPIHVASGTYALSPEEVQMTQVGVVRDCYRVGEQPAIPGSSLKGAIRAIVEAVTASCLIVTKVNTNHLPDGAMLTTDCQPEQACPACSMFGMRDRLGKISFTDALCELGQRTEAYHLPPLHRPHPDSPVYLDEQDKYRGRKFYYHGQPTQDLRRPVVEVIPEKGKLKGSVDFINLTAVELGLLFFAMGLDRTFYPKIGGGKPTCLGSLRFDPLELVFWEKDDLIDYNRISTERYQEENLQSLIKACINQASTKGYLLPDQVKALRNILHYPNNRDCPSGSY